jgi:hypothetical protein
MVFNIQNNLTYFKSFIKIDIVKKMYKEIIKISDNIHNTINSIFNFKNTNLYEKKLLFMMVLFFIYIILF